MVASASVPAPTIVAGVPVTTAPAPVIPAAVTPQALLAHLQARWGGLARAALSEDLVVLATALTDSAPISLASNQLTIELPAAFCAQLDGDPDLARRLRQLVAGIAGRELMIIARPRRGQTGGDERSRRYRSAQEHPLVQALLTRFEADIVARELIDPDAATAGNDGK